MNMATPPIARASSDEIPSTADSVLSWAHGIVDRIPYEKLPDELTLKMNINGIMKPVGFTITIDSGDVPEDMGGGHWKYADHVGFHGVQQLTDTQRVYFRGQVIPNYRSDNDYNTVQYHVEITSALLAVKRGRGYDHDEDTQLTQSQGHEIAQLIYDHLDHIRTDIDLLRACVNNDATSCMQCGRVLTTEISKALGIGPDCAAALGLPHNQTTVNAIKNF